MSGGNSNIAVLHAVALCRAGISSLLARSGLYEVAEFDSISALDKAAAEGQTFEAVLVDLRLIKPDVGECICRLRTRLPEARIAILSSSLDTADLRTTFAAGADGLILESVNRDTLLSSIKLILLGEKYFPSQLANVLSTAFHAPIHVGLSDTMPLPELSDRELEILNCLVEGCSNKHIALRLNIAEATVKVHLKSILRKIQVDNRTQAAIWALQRGVATFLAVALPVYAVIRHSGLFALAGTMVGA